MNTRGITMGTCLTIWIDFATQPRLALSVPSRFQQRPPSVVSHNAFRPQPTQQRLRSG